MTTSAIPTVSPITRIEALYERLTRARTLVADGKVHPIYGLPNHYVVEGATERYLVNGSCNCPDATHRPELKGMCKHKLADIIVSEQTANAETPQAETAPPETERTLEDKLADLYPKARPTNSPR
jgi:hypothetical protein